MRLSRVDAYRAPGSLEIVLVSGHYEYNINAKTSNLAQCQGRRAYCRNSIHWFFYTLVIYMCHRDDLSLYSINHSSTSTPILRPIPRTASHPTFTLHLPDRSIMSPAPTRTSSRKLTRVVKAIPISPSIPALPIGRPSSIHSVRTAAKTAIILSSTNVCEPSSLRAILRCFVLDPARAAPVAPPRRRFRP